MSAPLARRLAKSRRPPLLYPSLAVRLGVDSGVHRLLETPLVANGAEGSSILRFNAADAAPGGWPEVGGAVTLALASGSPTYDVASPFLESTEVGVTLNNSPFVDPGTVVGNLGLLDSAFELAWIVPAARGNVVGKYNNATTLGWFSDSYNNLLYFRIADGAGHTAAVAAQGFNAGELHYATGFCNHDVASAAGMQMFLGRAASGAGADPSGVGSADNTKPLSIGVLDGSVIPLTGTILYLALHSRADWFAGAGDAAEWLAIHKERHALLFGSRPMISWGGGTGPVAAGSTTPAYQRKVTGGVTRLHYIGAGAPRFERVLDADGREFIGALVEPGAINALFPSDPGGWTRSDAGDSFAADAADPAGGTSAASWVLSATSGAHALNSAAGGRIASGTACLSVLAKNGPLAKNWICLAPNGGSCWATFNMLTGEFGSMAGAAAIEGLPAEHYGDAWWLFSFVHTAANIAPMIYAADGPADLTVQGDASAVYAYMWGAQLEAGAWHSSRIVTATTAVTRAADSPLRYDLTNILTHGSQGAIRFSFLAPATPQTLGILLSLDDASEANRIEFGIYGPDFGASSGYVYAISRKAGGTDGDCAPIVNRADNRVHDVMISWCEGIFDLWVDGVLTRDASCTPPLGSVLTRLNLGSSYGSSWQCGPVMVGSDVKISPRYQSSWTRQWSGWTVLP